MADIFLIISFALINYIRGRGLIPGNQHVTASGMWAFAAGGGAWMYGYDYSYICAVILLTFLGMLIWVVRGWGLYFSSFHGRWKRDETEVEWIDKIGMKLVPFISEGHLPSNRKRGLICMSLRGLYVVPYFWLIGQPLLGVVIGLLQGPSYGVMRYLKYPDKGAVYAEPLIASIIGAGVAHALAMGFV